MGAGQLSTLEARPCPPVGQHLGAGHYKQKHFQQWNQLVPSSPCTIPAADALMWAGFISVATGAALLCEGAFARVERGCGLPDLRRLPYFPQVGTPWQT